MFHFNSDQSGLALQGSRLIKHKLAHNASSQSELWEARHTIPEFTMLDKLSQSSMGGNPRYKGSPQASGVIEQPGRSREDGQRWGNARSKKQSDSR